MSTKKLFLLFILIIGATLLSGCQEIEANSVPKASKTCPGKDAKFSIDFFKTNNQGKRNQKGINNVIIFNPKSAKLDFKVNVGLSHKLYAKDAKGKLRKEYVPKQFRELIGDENAKLNGQLPIAAINADYIGTDDKPQGLNVSRGVEYSGAFKNNYIVNTFLISFTLII
ncbi:hypothetical protein LC574_11800, partial [Nostoc sp. CHAB 5715]|nr:hypothetical protein [Nostoc sp. CHAB 5715]